MVAFWNNSFAIYIVHKFIILCVGFEVKIKTPIQKVETLSDYKQTKMTKFFNNYVELFSKNILAICFITILSVSCHNIDILWHVGHDTDKMVMKHKANIFLENNSA